MGVHSGKFGVVDGASTVRNWSINDEHASNAYVASNTLFGTGRRKGVRSWSGSFGYYGHTPPVLPGALFTFAGYTAPDDDVSGDGVRYDGSAMATSITVSWDWSSGAIIGGVVNFNGHLKLTPSVGAQVFDETVPVVPPSVGTKIEYDTLPSTDFEEWCHLLSAELTITNAVQSYVNSCTVVDGDLWTGQKSGPIDATLAVTEQSTDRTLFDIGDDLDLKLYVSAAAFWHLTWMHVDNVTGLTVDRESGAIMQQTVNFGMQGFDVTAGSYAASQGKILLPSGSEFWPNYTPATTTA
jgi:hypothetical protein